MKKFFTNIAMSPEKLFESYSYEAVGNSHLSMASRTHFPIIPAINGYVQPGETIRVFAVVGNTENEIRNLGIFQSEFEQVCSNRNILCPGHVEVIKGPKDQNVDSQLSIFQKLLDYMDDSDELFACLTYGTKMMSMSLLSAIRYAYRLKRNVSISCIVYGEVVRPAPDKKTWRPYIYDETALIQMDEITRMLAERGVENPRAFIQGVLEL